MTDFSYGTISPVYYTNKNGERVVSCYRGRKGIGTNPLTGKYIQKSFTSATEEGVKKRMRDFFNLPFDANELSQEGLYVEDWTNYWLNNIKIPTIKESSCRSYRNNIAIINASIGNRLLKIANRFMLQNIINERAMAGFNTTGLQIIMKECFRDAFELKLMNVDITKGLVQGFKATKCKNPLTKEESQKLIKLVRGTEDENLIYFLRGSALRINEALGLTWDRVFEDESFVVVGQQLRTKRIGNKIEAYIDYSTKNGVVSSVYLPKYACDALKKERAIQMTNRKTYENEFKNKLDLVFTDKYGNALTAPKVHYRLKKYGGKIGRPDLTAHVFRHTRASEIYEQTKDPLVDQALLRHKSFYSTLRYLHYIEGNSKSMVEIMQQDYDDLMSLIE